MLNGAKKKLLKKLKAKKTKGHREGRFIDVKWSVKGAKMKRKS